MSNTIHPKRFRIGEVAKLKGLDAPEHIYNGKEVLIKSNAYWHKEAKTLVINVEFEDVKGMCVTPWNLEKISEEDWDAMVDHRYLNPNSTDRYDGNDPGNWNDCVWKPVGNDPGNWNDCVWKPDPNFGKDDYSL